MARGYYTRTVIAAWDWRGGQFTRRWTFDTNSSTNSGKGYDGQGNHQLSVADVDGDGRDEIVYGAMAVDDNGNALWTTRNGHGDAMHVGDFDPSRAGLEEFKVDEDGSKPSSWMADARTGQILWSTGASGDNGRGVADVPRRSPPTGRYRRTSWRRCPWRTPRAGRSRGCPPGRRRPAWSRRSPDSSSR
ncbi:hypothetical protein SVIOM342S_08907 [Streptomyces violaceorubidus]